MKRALIFGIVGVVMGVGVTAAAQQFPKHPNLSAAYGDLGQAAQSVSAAQQANEWDMQGHAAKAKALIAEAQSELGQSAKSANK
jgi:hypothetical protein